MDKIYLDQERYYKPINDICTKYRIPYVYDWTMSLHTNMNYLIKLMNGMAIEFGIIRDIIDEFIKMFDADLQETIIKTLEQWEEEGKLEGIINEALFNQKLDKDIFENYELMNNAKVERLDDYFVKLDDFNKELGDSSDSQRLQRAVNHIRENKRGGTIFLGYNNILIDETILLDHNVKLIGEGVGATTVTVLNNISFVKNKDNKRKDYIIIKDLTIKRNPESSVPLIDFSMISYSRLEGLYMLSANEGKNIDDVGIFLKGSSHYNHIVDCQLVHFNKGIVFKDQANGNTVTGGACLLNKTSGVVIDWCDSNKLISHSVELEAQNAYEVLNNSYYNDFVSCRVEKTKYSYTIPYNADKPSFSNMIIGGLDFSKDGLNISGSNPVFDSKAFYEFRQWSSKVGVLTDLASESVPAVTDGTKLLFNRVFQDRTKAYSNGEYTINEKGIYNINVALWFSNNQDTCGLEVLVNGAANPVDMRTEGRRVYFSGNMALEKNDVISFRVKPATNSSILQVRSRTYISITRV